MYLPPPGGGWGGSSTSGSNAGGWRELVGWLRTRSRFTNLVVYLLLLLLGVSLLGNVRGWDDGDLGDVVRGGGGSEILGGGRGESVVLDEDLKGMEHLIMVAG
jgi:hypothetical protein